MHPLLIALKNAQNWREIDQTVCAIHQAKNPSIPPSSEGFRTFAETVRRISRAGHSFKDGLRYTIFEYFCDWFTEYKVCKSIDDIDEGYWSTINNLLLPEQKSLYDLCVLIARQGINEYAAYYFGRLLRMLVKQPTTHARTFLHLLGTQEFAGSDGDRRLVLEEAVEELKRKKEAGLPLDHAWSQAGAAAAVGNCTRCPDLDKRLDEVKGQFEKYKKEMADKETKFNALEREIDELRKRLNPAAFVKDKLYLVDFVSNGIQPPAKDAPFGSILKIPQTAPFVQEARTYFRKGGSWAHGIAPVAGFTLEEVQIIHADPGGLESRMRRLQALRAQNPGTFFNPSTGDFNSEQLQLLISLRDQFLPRAINAHQFAPNLINVFHGTTTKLLSSVANGIVAVRSTDSGFYGLGVYTTPNLEYAAKYATGDITGSDSTPRADGCFPVVWCVAAVGVCYPLTMDVDCKKKAPSEFLGAPLKTGYDCHCVAVSSSNNYNAVPRAHMQYMEIVFDQDIQVLPIGVLWMKPV